MKKDIFKYYVMYVHLIADDGTETTNLSYCGVNVTVDLKTELKKFSTPENPYCCEIEKSEMDRVIPLLQVSEIRRHGKRVELRYSREKLRTRLKELNKPEKRELQSLVEHLRNHEVIHFSDNIIKIYTDAEITEYERRKAESEAEAGESTNSGSTGAMIPEEPIVPPEDTREAGA